MHCDDPLKKSQQTTELDPRFRIRIHIILGSWIRIWIRTRAKNWIRIHNFKLQELKMEPWRAVNAHNGGVEALNGAVEGL